MNPEAVRLDVLMLPRMLHVGLALVFSEHIGLNWKQRGSTSICQRDAVRLLLERLLEARLNQAVHLLHKDRRLLRSKRRVRA